MKKPFWLLNLILLAVLIVSIVFAFWTRVQVPSPTPAKKPAENSVHAKRSESIENLLKNDPFGTVSGEHVIEKPVKQTLPKLPLPPRKIIVNIPPISKPKLIDPLAIKITGIAYFGDIDKDTIFIQNNRTKNESSYKTGDQVEDAQVIRILKNKAVMLRSNGQQEVLYLNKSEQETDAPSRNIPLGKKTGAYDFEINIENFAKEIKDLNKLIFELDAKNAIKDNAVAGIRIGNAGESRIAKEIGLEPKDIITEINSISVADAEGRVAAFDSVFKLEAGSKFSVNLIRGGRNISLNYKLVSEEIKKQKKRSIKQPAASGANIAEFKSGLAEAKSKDLENILKLKKLNNENS